MNRFDVLFLFMLLFLFIVLLGCGVLYTNEKLSMIEKQISVLQEQTKEAEEELNRNVRILEGQVDFFISGGWK